MSDSSNEGLVQPSSRPRSDEATAAARKITSLSDDESDDGRPSLPTTRRMSPLPERHNEDSGFVNEDFDREDSPEVEMDREQLWSPSNVDCYSRNVGMDGSHKRSVNMIHFPPNISFHEGITTNLEKVPIVQNPILYRLKPGVRKGRAPVDALLDEYKKNPDPLALNDLLQSNANLITWSDGSKTIAIGSHQFLLIEDVVGSKHHIFLRGDKIQTYNGDVKSVLRAQPSSTVDASAKLAMATAASRAANSRSAGRTMLRCMNDGGEQEEEKAKIESQKRERERARMEAKRRQIRERHVRPSRGLTVDALESNGEDSDDDHVRRMEERLGESRLMRSKRSASSRGPDVSVKRRKAGGRRVLVADDDDEGDGDESSE